MLTCAMWLCLTTTAGYQPFEGLPPPQPVGPPYLSIPGSPPPFAARPMTVQEFAAGFKPAPGTYEVILIHPRTGCPVKVCFTLPPCCLKKVCVRKRELKFDYGQHEVEIRFKLNGTVKVKAS